MPTEWSCEHCGRPETQAPRECDHCGGSMCFSCTEEHDERDECPINPADRDAEARALRAIGEHRARGSARR